MDMILILLIIIPVIASIGSWISAGRNAEWPRWICLTALFADMLIILFLWTEHSQQAASAESALWLAAVNLRWIPQLGIGFQLAMDGLSLLMVALTVLLGMAAVVCSWTEIQERVGFFHFNLMACLAGIIGVFLATDLVLFYIFWEVMLVPMYFLIGIWGHENRIYAAIKFFIFTQAGGLFMLMAILGLYFVHGLHAGVYTFNYFEMLGTPLPALVGFGLMLGFFIAFAVKLPAVPFHTWLADAHTEAPTAGSVILAGLLLKTGGYGLIRFILPLFPEALDVWAPFAMGIGVVGIIYGALMAFAQTDLKRLVAYTSISHLGFVLLGVFTRNDLALFGAVMQMICHGISTGALFILVGIVQERIGTRDLNQMGGLWSVVPRMSGVTLIFALASLGLPGLGNFVGEFLVLVGTFGTSPWMAAPAAVGLVLSVVYSLRIMGKAFYGPKKLEQPIQDLSPRETCLAASLIVAIIWLGVFPQVVLNTVSPTVKAIQDPGRLRMFTNNANPQAVALPRSPGILSIVRQGGSNR
ncbi:MAG TPA: NADH-quinone oxidoreductase subunit M [Desulfomonilaceae bacterium]|nr:NADH-quinone oxidoreductase subunit M [Desulfomonilaceae bacterium]